MSIYPQIADNEQLIHLGHAAKKHGFTLMYDDILEVGKPIRHRLQLMRGDEVKTTITTTRAGKRAAIADLAEFLAGCNA